MSNVVSLGKKRKPVANVLAEPLVKQMPTTLAGSWAAAVDENFIVPASYVGWLDTLVFRDGVGKVFSYEDEGGAVAIVLNNVCRRDVNGSITWRLDRRPLVLEVLQVFKGKAYVEYHSGFTGISIIVNGYAGQAGRGFNNYRWIEIIDYTLEDKVLPMSGYQLSDWSVAEPCSHEVGLDWIHERVMVPDDAPASEADNIEIDNAIDLIINERNRLVVDVEGGTESKPLLSDVQQLAVLNALLDMLIEPQALFPYVLLDGFMVDGH